ncbi:5'-nucleotidase SurE [Candidatus Phycosocius bacilliformis]|uniref:5'-nucleotidase SurE n=1 Tax=Candidatus Phycosocius bacilliformis TaxID=1445552 RepID=A0A2P2EC43_9PROT|nr:5'/3'-nucleotidase SurE [Candidatus Phycosocius bacilliformis]GBF58638.1 5'-nucleotidase SurE [Candidatus Phycosocius bacilliformis]
MRILISNDDGIHAPGLAVLEAIAHRLSDDVWVVAPEVERSGASRAVTLTEPVRVRTIGPRRFACSGTPSDCVLLGIDELVAGGKPDLVLSGVNRGQNLAEDTSVSGTVAAAVQAMQLGIPAIALSQAVHFRVGQPIAWHTAQTHGPGLVQKLLAAPWPSGVVMNVNFPDCEPEDVTGIEATFQGFRDESIHQIDRRADLRGNDYYWIGYRGKLSKPPAGSDLLAIYENRISVSPLHIDMTEHGVLPDLRRVLQA